MLVGRIENLILKRDGKRLQDPISFNWKQGEFWCVTGPSGSGKSTLLKMLSGQTFASQAKIEFPMIEQLRLKEENSRMIADYIGYVPQEMRISAGFIQDLYYQRRYQSAEQDEIPTTRQVLLRSAPQKKSEVDEVAALLNLTKLLDQPFVQLSNGQSRRLMIAIALIKNPKILMLDNPYTGLDATARVSLNIHLKNLSRQGIHLFMAAHEHELAELDFITHVLRLEPVFRPKTHTSLSASYRKVPGVVENMTIIDAENIKVNYGTRKILDIPSWKVKALDRWIIQGDNGSGKSTLLALITADHPQAYSNNIFLFGKKRGSGESIWEIKKRIGYFSSELLRYFSKLPVAEEVIASGWNDITGQIKKLTVQQRESVKALADWLGISPLLAMPIGKLSLGQQKMVLIARAMIRNPEILILDEPLQGMDAEWREHFKKKIDEFSQSRTILYVTHDEAEIPDGAWKILNLNRK